MAKQIIKTGRIEPDEMCSEYEFDYAKSRPNRFAGRRGRKEAAMNEKYVQFADGVWRVADTRVSLDSLVYAFWNGDSAETIAQAFPALTLAQVYGALAFYLDHRVEIDKYLEQRRTEYEAKRQASREASPEFYRRMKQ